MVYEKAQCDELSQHKTEPKKADVAFAVGEEEAAVAVRGTEI